MRAGAALWISIFPSMTLKGNLCTQMNIFVSMSLGLSLNSCTVLRSLNFDLHEEKTRYNMESWNLEVNVILENMQFDSLQKPQHVNKAIIQECA